MRPIELNALFRFAAVADRHRSAADPAVEQVRSTCRPGSPSRACSICCGTCPTASSTGAPSRPSPRPCPGTIATLKVRVLKHKPAAARQHPSAPTRSRSRTIPAASTSCSSTPSASSSSASSPWARSATCRAASSATARRCRCRIPTTSWRRRPRDDLPMLEPVYPLTAGPLRQDRAEGHTPGARSPARGPRVAGAAMAQGARLAGLRRGAAAPAPADRCSRRVAGRAALATARLRRAARGPARARARAA